RRAVAEPGAGASQPGWEKLGEVDRVAAKDRQGREAEERDHPPDLALGPHGAEDEENDTEREEERHEEGLSPAEIDRKPREGHDPEERADVLKSRGERSDLILPRRGLVLEDAPDELGRPERDAPHADDSRERERHADDRSRAPSPISQEVAKASELEARRSGRCSLGVLPRLRLA